MTMQLQSKIVLVRRKFVQGVIYLRLKPSRGEHFTITPQL